MKCGDCGEEIDGSYYEHEGRSICKKDYQKYRKRCGTCDDFITGVYYTQDTGLICANCYKEKVGSLQCNVCDKCVTGEIIRAVNTVFHPECFKCFACNVDLSKNDVPFKADKEKRVYCLKDYQERYSTRCCACNEPIAPTPGCTSVERLRIFDKDWHTHCFKCQDCKKILDGDKVKCYPVNEVPFCIDCVKDHCN
ncbi:lipoma-preferred partner [Lepeophtheirus salmonis]|nr:lipoma-preferred partner-like [Lepeophtheirus salmonis]